MAWESEVTEALLDWYATSRRDLPWRRDHAPYAVWISEIMVAIKPLTDLFGRTLSKYFPIFAVSRETVLLGLGFGVLVGVLAAVVPAWRVRTTAIAAAFRRIG